MSYVTASGQVLTDETIDSWCEAYEKGEFPTGEHSVGPVVYGRPPRSQELTTTMTVKIPVGMKVALTKRAEKQGMTMSSYVRNVLASSIL